MLNNKQFRETIKGMKTILWEAMDDHIYAEYDTFEDAVNGEYYIGTDDYFEIRDGVLWIALND